MTAKGHDYALGSGKFCVNFGKALVRKVERKIVLIESFEHVERIGRDKIIRHRM